METLRSAFVVASTLSYVLPAYEGLKRGSIFYVVLPLSLLLLSSVTHCEETGLCEPLPPASHARLSGLSHALSFFLFGTACMVTFEIKSERLGRVVSGVWAALLWAAGSVAATVTNVAATFAVQLLLLAWDVKAHNRRFTPAQGRRLGLIAGMAVVGLGLFKLMATALWSHGMWHIYSSLAIYLLLLAQRHKRMLASRAAARDGSGSGHSSSVGAATPLKRRAGATATLAPADGSGEREDGTGEGGLKDAGAPVAPPPVPV